MFKIHNPGWQRHCEHHDPLEDLGNFIHGCAEDPITRVMSATALVLALGQVAGPTMLRQPPGFLLINASGEATDPIDEVMKTLTGLEKPRPRPGPEVFERNRKTMRVALLTLEKEQANFRPVPPVRGHDPDASRQSILAGPYRKALRENFGFGRAGWYADRHDELFGWLTDETNHTILRLDRDQDRLRLREDMRLRPQCFIEPKGYGTAMCRERKSLSIAGSLPVSQWDQNLVFNSVENAIPLLFLPHTAAPPLVTPAELHWLSIGFASIAGTEPLMPVRGRQRLQQFKEEWVNQRIARLRLRLGHFPPDYEYFVTSVVRELLPCCQRLVSLMATQCTPRENQSDLVWDLFTMALQGLCLSVEALGWHGYGFEAHCDRAKTCRVLAAIRDRGSISKRDLLRNQQWLDAENREAILTAFEAEGLIQMTDQEVTALPFTDYWRGVRHRAGRDMPAPFWKATARQAAATATAR